MGLSYSSFKADLETTFTAAFCPVELLTPRSTRPVAPLPRVFPNFQGPIFSGWLWEFDVADKREACLESGMIYGTSDSEWMGGIKIK